MVCKGFYILDVTHRWTNNGLSESSFPSAVGILRTFEHLFIHMERAAESKEINNLTSTLNSICMLGVSLSDKMRNQEICRQLNMNTTITDDQMPPKLVWPCHQNASLQATQSGPNFIALLNGKQICVLTVAEKFA